MFVQVNPRSAPVIVYVEGGPGMTSFFNSFLQHGPFNLTSKGELEMARRTNIWFNTIYIDSLAGTGFSFMHQDAAYPRTHKRIAQELLEALKQFFKMCAHFRGNDFYVAGESMTGKIVPRLTSAIHFDNEKVSQEEKINLKGMIIGNGFMDPKNQLAYGKYLNAMGLIDNKTALQLESLETKIRTLIGHHNHIRAYDVVTNLFALLRQKIGYCSAVNILEPNSNTDPYSFVPWLERSDVRKALHVGSKPFTMLSYEAMEALKRVMTQSAANIIGAMLENYRTLVYTGNFGIACPYSSVHKSLLEIEWSGKKEFAAARQSQWRVPQESPDVSNVTGVLAGYVRKYNNLYEVLVRNAGHFPYMDQGNRMLQLLNHFVQNKL